MKLQTTLLIAFLALPIAAPLAGDLPQTGASPVPGATRDAGFLKQAGEAGVAEVQLGELALAQAESPEVRQFARRMVDAHTASNKELNLIAATQRQRLPSQMDRDHRELLERLDGLAGPAFDQAYMEAMVEDHRKLVALFELGKGTAGHSRVQKFARDKLALAQEHLEMAQELSEELR